MENNTVSKNTKKYNVLKIVGLSLAIFIGAGMSAFFINLAFKFPAPCPILQAEWEPGDALSFWGTLLGGGIGAVVTIIGVYLTLKESRKATQAQIDATLKTNNEVLEQNRLFATIERKNNVLPIITINRLLPEYRNYNFMIAMASKLLEQQPPQQSETIPIEDKTEYVELKLTELAFVFSNNSQINIFPHLTKQQQELIAEPYPITANGSRASLLVKKWYYVPFYFTNAGIGAAINLSVQLYEKGNLVVASQAVSLSPGQEIKVSFFAESYEWINPKYELKIVYFDIYKTKYQQNHEITFDQAKRMFSISLEINQHEVN